MKRALSCRMTPRYWQFEAVWACGAARRDTTTWVSWAHSSASSCERCGVSPASSLTQWRASSSWTASASWEIAPVSPWGVSLQPLVANLIKRRAMHIISDVRKSPSNVRSYEMIICCRFFFKFVCCLVYPFDSFNLDGPTFFVIVLRIRI